MQTAHRAVRVPYPDVHCDAGSGGARQPHGNSEANGACASLLVLLFAFLTFACGSPREASEQPRIAALTAPASLIDDGAVDVAPDRQHFNLEWVMRSAVDAGIQPVRVAGLSTREWKCSFYRPSPQHPALSVHLFKPVRSDLGAPVAIVSSNACWWPGPPDSPTPFLVPQPGGLGQPRSMVVLRQIRGVWSIAAPRGPPYTKIGLATVYGNWRDAGEVGGGGIVLHPPERPSLDVVDCIAARMPVAAFHSLTGEILTRENGLGTWFEYRLDRGDGPIFRYPHFLREPAFDPDAWAVRAFDQYHGARAFMDWLGDYRATRSPISRTLILVAAEDARTAYTLSDVPQWSDQWTPFSLKRDLAAARANPGKGGRIVRGTAWTLRLFVAALEVGPPNRAQFEAVVESLLLYVRATQLPSGAFYDARFGAGLDQDEPWLQLGLDRRRGEQPSWQSPFLIRACWEAQKQVPRLRPLAREIVLNAEKMWGPKTPRVPAEDNLPYVGLPRYLVTSIDGVPVLEITEGVGPSRPFYDADAFAVFAEARTP